MAAGNRTDMPGMVRISFGLYNTLDEIDALIEALQKIAAGKYHGHYTQDRATGEFHPKGWEPEFEKFYSL